MTSFQTLNSCPQLHTETSMHTYQLEVNSRKHWAHTQSVTAAQNAWERRESWQITTPDTHQWNYSSNQRVLPHKLNLAKATQNWVLSEDLGGRGGVTSKDSVVTVATTGQNFDQLFWVVWLLPPRPILWYEEMSTQLFIIWWVPTHRAEWRRLMEKELSPFMTIFYSPCTPVVFTLQGNKTKP